MDNLNIFLIGMSIFAIIGSILVYKMDFNKWEKNHG